MGFFFFLVKSSTLTVFNQDLPIYVTEIESFWILYPRTLKLHRMFLNACTGILKMWASLNKIILSIFSRVSSTNINILFMFFFFITGTGFLNDGQLTYKTLYLQTLFISIANHKEIADWQLKAVCTYNCQHGKVK